MDVNMAALKKEKTIYSYMLYICNTARCIVINAQQREHIEHFPKELACVLHQTTVLKTE
jgi:hypothetical protein